MLQAPRELNNVMCLKHKVVANGCFFAELDDFLSRELSDCGYAGVTVKSDAAEGYEIVVQANQTAKVYGENSVRLASLLTVICQRFNLSESKVKLFVKKVQVHGLSAAIQCEALRYRLQSYVPVRRAAYSILRSAQEAGALGCEVIIAGKSRAQRAKDQKYSSGYILRTGQPAKDFVQVATRNLTMPQGVLGITVKIMLPPHIAGIAQPDVITINEVKDDVALPKEIEGAVQAL